MIALRSSPPSGPDTPACEPADAVSASPAPPHLPRTFGAYTLFEEIGRGGMAQIYLARAETELGATRRAVVKQILPAFADDPRFAEMLIHEAKLAARLGHRRIVQVLDLGKHEEHLYIAMEYVEGFDLNALLRHCTEQKVPLPAPHALGIVADVLEGLDYAHRRNDENDEPLGIVHRDVSPSNILISYEGEVKLCDFGIAHANDLVKEDASDALKGKAGYMSPEHARGEALDARADVFAAGIILWELLAGRRLYRPRSETALILQAQAAEIPPIPDKGIPNHAQLEAIARRALAKNREDRFSSAGAMLRELESYMAENGLLASRLKLGEWISTSFGTELVERRRASECRLPKLMGIGMPVSGLAKSAPPPRSSGWIRAIPQNDLGPEDAVHAPALQNLSDLPVSNGAVRAFKKELESGGSRLSAEPGSLGGAAMDLPLSSRNPVAVAGSSPAADEKILADPSKPESAAVVSARRPRPHGLLLAVALVALVAALVAAARVFVH